MDSIIHGDCETILEQIPSNSIDLLIADPPYVISKDSQFHTMKDRKNPRTGTKFEEWDDEFDNSAWIKEGCRVLKDGGSAIVFNDFKKATLIYDLFTEHSMVYKDTLVWRKTNPMPRNRDRRYIPDVEMYQWYVKPKGKWIFNRQDEKYESSILTYPSESGGGFKRYHQNQKPVNLFCHIIALHSNEGDIVLDPFIGGGTTAIACLKLNRTYIGIDISEKHCETTRKRIMDYTNVRC